MAEWLWQQAVNLPEFNSIIGSNPIFTAKIWKVLLGWLATGFESRRIHGNGSGFDSSTFLQIAGLAQWDRASGYEPEGYMFEPCALRQ